MRRCVPLKSRLLSAAGRPLSLAALLAGVLPSAATTVDVTDQAEFDAAIQQAITTGQPDTIDIHIASPGTISTGAGLVLPGAAAPLNLNFDTAPDFGIGYNSVGDLTIGPGANLNFAPTTSYARLRVGYDAGSNGTITMTGGTITGVSSPSYYLVLDLGRQGGVGLFNQSGGAVNIGGGAFQVGVGGGQGTYNLSGDATLNVGGGVGTVYLGDSPGGNGALNVSGNASYTSGSQMFVGNGTGAVGTITQNGAGSLVILSGNNVFGTNINDPPNPGGTGTYTLISGSLEITTGAVADFANTVGSTGTLNQSGGVLTTAGTGLITIGESAAGQYNLSGGVATLADGLIIGQFVGSTGAVNQTGGVLTLSGGVLSIGVGGTGAYNLNGGMLQVGGAGGIVGTGDLNIAGGALRVTGAALTTANAVTLAGANSTIDTNGLGATFSGAVTGGGALTKLGAGALILTGTDLYAGGTTISAGTLQIGNGGATGSIVGNVVDNATLAFDRSNASAFAGAISGSGGLTKLGAGVLTLSGAGSYAGATLVSAGTLQAGAVNAFSAASAYTVAAGATLDLGGFSNAIGSLAGAGLVSNVGAGLDILTAGGNNSSTTFSGVIEDDGPTGLTKTGTGALTLTGINTYTGPTLVQAGTLIVDGSIATSSSLTVDAGATLAGSGTVGGFVVPAGATVAPGAATPYSTLHIGGTIGFLTGSYYNVDIDAAGATDRILATGAATLTGGTVNVVAASGVYSPALRYTILTANGGVTGEFAALTIASNLPFLTPSLSYEADDVFLNFTRSANAFASVAATPNQAAVAAAAQALGAGNLVFDAILGQTPASARAAFDALSGEAHASAVSAAFEDASLARGAVLDRLASPYGALPTTGGATGFAAMNAIAGPSVAPDMFAAWGQAFGAFGRIGGDGNAASLSRSGGGLITGVDATLDNRYRLGVAAGYSQSTFSADARNSSGHVDSTFAGVYAGASLNALQLRGGGFYAFNRYGVDRAILFPGFADNTSSSYGGYSVQAFGEAGWRTPFGRAFLEPIVGLTAMHIATNSYAETGGAAALTGAAQGYDYAATTLGLRAETSLFADAPLLARGMIGWRHAFGDVTPGSTLAFVSAPTNPFAIAGAPIARDALALEAGLDWKLTRNATIGVFYAGDLAARDADNAIKGKVELAF